MHHHFLSAKVALVVEADAPQEPYSLAHALKIAAWDVEFLRHARSCAHENGIIAHFKEFLDGQITLAYGGVAMEHHTQLFYLLNLTAYDFLGQAIFRNAKHQYPSRFWFHLKNFNIEALSGHVAGNGQSGRARTDNGYLTSRLWQ